jgi:hypothetical protein
MKLKTLLKKTSLLAVCSTLFSAANASAAPTDNVVIIHVDDLGWRDLACMGSPVYETPHIDALAKGGIV